ncbi:MAG: lamin tail domain-containing protein, partial [Phycisphaerales bacterium]
MRMLLPLLALTLSLTNPLKAVCPVGDLNADCKVDSEDLVVFAGQWLDQGCPAAGCEADLDDVGGVNTADFALLAENWQRIGATLVINEFMARNNGSIRDPYGDDDDWIEIYNTGDDAVNIGGMYLTDNLSAPTKWRVPDTDASATTIPAK